MGKTLLSRAAIATLVLLACSPVAQKVRGSAGAGGALELARRVRTACHRRGLLIEIGGHYSNVARFLPPLVLTEDLSRKGLHVFADAVREVESLR